MSEYLGGLESYKELDGATIRSTKIHKVLKAMLKLDTIPLDEEFEFKDRCRKLLAMWATILESDPNDAGDKDDKAEPATGALTEQMVRRTTQRSKRSRRRKAKPLLQKKKKRMLSKTRLVLRQKGKTRKQAKPRRLRKRRRPMDQRWTVLQQRNTSRLRLRLLMNKPGLGLVDLYTRVPLSSPSLSVP